MTLREGEPGPEASAASPSCCSAGRAVSVTGIALAVIGLAATTLSTAAEFGGSSLDLGLGPGGMERIADYPGSLWILMIGIIAVLSARAGHHAAPSSR
jgi:hypothetical protein